MISLENFNLSVFLFLQFLLWMSLILLWLKLRGMRGLLKTMEVGAERESVELMSKIRQEFERSERLQVQLQQQMKQDIADQVSGYSQLLTQTIQGMREDQSSRLSEVGTQLFQSSEKYERQLEGLTKTVDSKLASVLQSNQHQLEKMRETVDEKLQGTLNKRLNESFEMVSKRLEMVHQGLGQMQELSTGMGDLRRILTNVKVRGTWAEYQLGHLLEQSLSLNMFEKNFAVKPRSPERVDFAIKLPGSTSGEGKPVYLPIDSKFPQESYQRLVDASTKGEPVAIQKYHVELLSVVKKEAKRISDKYIHETITTPFAILFLATEGLYAEVLREPGFADTIQHEYRILIAGPTSLSALLASLQMGFQTLSLQQQSGQIWKHLSQIRKNFGEFSKLLEGVHKKLDSASLEVGKASKKSQTIENRLNRFESFEDQTKEISGAQAEA